MTFNAPTFSPWATEQRPCWHCHRFQGLSAQGTVALCDLPRAPRVRSQPERGCSAFEREPGADDDPQQRPVCPPDVADAATKRNATFSRARRLPIT